MKRFAKFLLIGMTVPAAYFCCQRNPSSSNQAPTSAEFASTISASSDLAASSLSIQTSRPQKSSDPLARSLALLRSKLHEWQESETNDPDDEEGRDQLLREMLAVLTDENVAAMVQSLSAEEMNTPFGIGALHRWMQVDPVAATNWLASRASTTEDQTLAVAEDWASHQDALQQYLEQLPDTAWKQIFLEKAGSALSLKDSLEAIKLAQQMNPGDAQTNLLRSVVCGWVSTDPKAAMDWAAGVKDPQLREQLIASAVQSYALNDPAQAATWLVSEVKSSGIVMDAALNILETWVATDPAAAANWTSLFPEGDFKIAAMKIVSRHWRQTDPAAASAWIQDFSGDSATPAN
jgi:hypothetical protein